MSTCSLDDYYKRLQFGPPMKAGEEMQYEILRTASFNNWPLWGRKRPIELAKKGFYYLGNDDFVKCFACDGEIGNWSAQLDIDQEHEKRFSVCPLVRQTVASKEMGPPKHIKATTSTGLSLGEASYQSSSESMTLHDTGRCMEYLRQPARSQPNNIENPQQMAPLLAAAGNSSLMPIGGVGGQQLKDMHDSGFESAGTPTWNDAVRLLENLSLFRSGQNHLATPINSPATEMTSLSPLSELDLDLVKYENYRLRSFIGKWPENSYVSPTDLAKAGFYYRGSSDNVQCAFCRGRLLNWAPNDDPMCEHQRHYPRCPFILGEEVGNVSAESENYERAEFPQSLAKKPENTTERLGVMIDRPIHPEYAIESNRQESFKTWPKKSIVDPEALSRAGFFYVGYSDNVKCFFCDGGLRNWAVGDDPWKEHVRWFSKCGYIRLNLSESEIQTLKDKPNADNNLELHNNNPVAPPSAVFMELTDPRAVIARLEMPLVKNIIGMGFSKDLVKKVLQDRLLTAGDDFASSEELLQAVLIEDESQKTESTSQTKTSRRKKKNRKRKKKNHQIASGQDNDDEEEDDELNIDPTVTEDPDIQRLTSDYEKIREERTCKICMDAECSIVFLPCGHLVCCSSCAPALRNCPICRTYIKGSVRMYTA